MITTEAKGNFTVPDGNVMKIMEGDCTGILYDSYNLMA